MEEQSIAELEAALKYLKKKFEYVGRHRISDKWRDVMNKLEQAIEDKIQRIAGLKK